jgi:2-polyprenyl-3-methyl-5-hydroxy-6-metoxy-1,4-benzoquinol methylase
VRSEADINKAAESYYFTSQQIGIDNRCRERMIRRCIAHVVPGDVLELGFMDGQWTDHFLAKGCRVTAVEGAERNFKFGQDKYRGLRGVTMVHSTFENFTPTQRYDLIHMGGVLKHLDDPAALLRRSIDWLEPKGTLIATTPNARSLHRRVGVHMGALKDLSSLSETDRSVGNLRHYDMDSFRSLLHEGGYEPVELATAVLKPLSSAQMTDFSDELLDALDKMADEIPDYGWYIYAVCKLRAKRTGS